MPIFWFPKCGSISHSFVLHILAAWLFWRTVVRAIYCPGWLPGLPPQLGQLLWIGISGHSAFWVSCSWTLSLYSSWLTSGQICILFRCWLLVTVSDRRYLSRPWVSIVERTFLHLSVVPVSPNCFFPRAQSTSPVFPFYFVVFSHLISWNIYINI